MNSLSLTGFSVGANQTIHIVPLGNKRPRLQEQAGPRIRKIKSPLATQTIESFVTYQLQTQRLAVFK
jgi:hypothetical protein